ncbi:MAG: hypothetical protein P8N67_08445 [Pseudomonadales bacterium]|nr:hypothetical protein [Pseudomonadales bacterium]
MQPPNNQPPIWCTADHLQVSLDRVRSRLFSRAFSGDKTASGRIAAALTLAARPARRDYSNSMP